MFYLVYFLTLFALFSAIFFICAVYSAAKFDRLFSCSQTKVLLPNERAVLKLGNTETYARVENISPSESGETVITLKLTKDD